MISASTILSAIVLRPTTRSREIRLAPEMLAALPDESTVPTPLYRCVKPLPLADVLRNVDALHAQCTTSDGRISHVCGDVPRFDLYTYVKALRAYRDVRALEAI